MPEVNLDNAKEKLVRYIRGHGVNHACGWVGSRPPVWQVACDVGDLYRSTWQLECEHGIRGSRYGGPFHHGSVSGVLGSRWTDYIEYEPERLPDCAKCLRNAQAWCRKEDRASERQQKRAAKAAKRQQRAAARSRLSLPLPVQWLFGVASLLGLAVALYLWWSA